jgi:hypothetical protein
MNKTEFIQLIQNHDLPAAKHVAALKQVVADFPYFTQARVLLAKALHNEKHYEYEKFLKRTALAVPDRDVLYHYLHNLTPNWQMPQLSISIEQPFAIEQNEIVPFSDPVVEQFKEEVNLPIQVVTETIISNGDIEGIVRSASDLVKSVNVLSVSVNGQEVPKGIFTINDDRQYMVAGSVSVFSVIMSSITY